MTRPKHILFADDEIDIVKVVKVRLQKEGYTVDTCNDGETAQSLITKKKYDLVILDSAMPKKNGEDVIADVRKLAKYDKLPILVMTAFRMRNEDFYKKLGATDIIYKPADDKDWLAVVRKYIN